MLNDVIFLMMEHLMSFLEAKVIKCPIWQNQVKSEYPKGIGHMGIVLMDNVCV